MAFKDLFTNRYVFCLIISCVLITSEGNEIMLQEHTDDVRITPATFTEASSASITITAPNNYRVLLKFLKVQLKDRGDSLYFSSRFGEDRFSKRLLSLSGRLSPPPPDLVSPGQRMSIAFSHSSHQISMETFILNATLVEEKEYSIKLVPGEMRNITSPSYPDNYPRNAFLFYTIDAPTGCRLKHLVLDEDIGHGDTLCISESKIAQRKEQCYVTENATSASLWFSSDSSFTNGRFFVSFWSVGLSDEEPCIQKSYGLSPAPRAHSSNTASKLTRKKRSDNNTGDVSTTSTQKPTKAEPTPKPWYQYSFWHIVGVLLAIVVIGVFLNQLVRHLMDLCCQTQPVTMTPASAQGRRSSRARSRCCPSWKLIERKSKYVVNKTGISSDDVTVTPGKMERNTENAKSEDTDYITMTTIAPSSRVPPRRNPSSVSETSHRSYKMYGTEGVAINEISSQSLKATTDSGDPSQGSRDIVSPGTKPASNLLRKSQSSLLGDTYVTGTFDGFDRPRLRSPDSSTPDQSLSKQPPVRHVKLREKSANTKFASNRRLSVSMFDLTNHDLADNEGFNPQLGLEHLLDGQITSSELHQQSNNLKTKGSLIRRRDHEAMSAVTSKDQAMFSSADSLPLICGDEGVQWYSPIEREKELIRKEDPYSTAMAKFDSLCSTLQAEAEGINPEYVNLPPINQNQFAALKRPDRPKPISLKPPTVARSLSASAHDLLSTSSSRIKDATKSHPTDDSGPSRKPSKVPHKPNLLSSTLRNPIPFLMERSVTTPADSQTTGNKERVSAYRSYCEIDDIEPGCGVETPGCMNDSQGYNLTNIRLDSI